MTKTKSIKKHFSRRMLERIEFHVTQTDMEQINKLIKDGRSKILERQTNRISLHEVTYHNTKLIIVHDKMRNLPVTVLI